MKWKVESMKMKKDSKMNQFFELFYLKKKEKVKSKIKLHDSSIRVINIEEQS
jgi:hypothetical protein